MPPCSEPRQLRTSTAAVFRFDPLRHVLGAFVMMVTQHAAGEVVSPLLRKIGPA
jgi:hypothetical protein